MTTRRYFSGKNLIVYILVAYAFYFLYKYRQNDPPPLYQKVKDFQIYTLDGKKFNLSDIKTKKVIIFLNKGNIYAEFYKKNMPELIFTVERYGGYLIVFVKTDQNRKSVLNYVNDKKYKIVEKHLYLTNIDLVEKIFGINSWPFLVIVDEYNRLIYASKFPIVKEIAKKLRGE